MDGLLRVRRESLTAKRSPDTLNHHRRVVRGVFGTHPASPALAWPWSANKEESEGKLRFYTPAQVRQLIAQARSVEDEAIFTLATEAGPRLSEIRARHSFGTQAIRAFNIYEVQRMMGHRHITTTERYLHYAPDPNGAAKLSKLWDAGA